MPDTDYPESMIPGAGQSAEVDSLPGVGLVLNKVLVSASCRITDSPRALMFACTWPMLRSGADRRVVGSYMWARFEAAEEVERARLVDSWAGKNRMALGLETDMLQEYQPTCIRVPRSAGMRRGMLSKMNRCVGVDR